MARKICSLSVRLALVLVFTGLFAGSDGFESIILRCCNLGVRWAWENRTCTTHVAPVSNVPPEHQASCLLSLNACCRKSYRERECIEGHVRAKSGLECVAGTGVYGSYIHDCCEGCKLGVLAGSLGLDCDLQRFKSSLGAPWDFSMTKCCLQAGGSQQRSSSTASRRNITRNEIPRYDECPEGFTFNVASQVCDDINECLLPVGAAGCPPYKRCVNTIGSFACVTDSEEADPDSSDKPCPAGYRRDASGTCADIDECEEGKDICVREIQYCINLPGGFDCKSKREFTKYNCPAGYKFNSGTLNCDDVDECQERIHHCDGVSETCRNTAGAYECDVRCGQGLRFDSQKKMCQDVDECREGTHDCDVESESCVNVHGSYQCHRTESSANNTCPPGYEPNRNYTFLCQDTDECATGQHTCTDAETCFNEVGGYRCESYIDEESSEEEDQPPVSRSVDGGSRSAATDDFYASLPKILRPDYQRPTAAPATTTTTTQSTISCSRGHRYIAGVGGGPGYCADIDECRLSNPCDSTQICQNNVGSYVCHCKSGYFRDPVTRACLDINECQTGQHTCTSSQRCDNSPGSFTCIRITGCGTGYTLNSATGECEDDDECLFGNHDCGTIGSDYVCKNTLGSFRCEKAPRSCPQGLSLAPTGECRQTCDSGFEYNFHGDCVDIDECQSRSGIRSVCPSRQQCVNTHGSYRCMSKVVCPVGHESDADSTSCKDINECERGTHTCSGLQTCYNTKGGYYCQCPTGYRTVNGTCEDVDECGIGRPVCASNSECYNTPGSYRCLCKEGFEQHQNDTRLCVDLDECTSISGLCEQQCSNTWGSFRCSCGSGFTLHSDGRSCRDVDECDEVGNGYLCIGECVNTHGSYRCDCPDGYSLGSDGRTCQDINECDNDPCRPDEHCLNVKGGYSCRRTDCPSGYYKDPVDKNRCKRERQCTYGSTDFAECMKEPASVSFNFLSFTSNVKMPSTGYIDIFNMMGPQWPGTILDYKLELRNARASQGIAVATRQYFLLRRPESAPYRAYIALAQTLMGPQLLELDLTMDVYRNNQYYGAALARIFIEVSRYEY